MNVEILYFARLREVFGMASERIELFPGARVAELLDFLRARGGVWAGELAAGKAYRIAVNQALAAQAQPLQAGDEVAIFPPVTGG
jgi:molybdopterin synthase sulfur carrier subunit